MTALLVKNSQLADSADKPLIGLRQSNIADAAITTATLSAASAATLTASKLTNLAIAYATDDPSITTDGTINIADGDAALDRAEVHIAIEELMDAINTLGTLTSELHDDAATNRTLLVELIADHATFITDVTDNNTKVNAILDVLEEHGLMTAT